jgi:hypothetical protein
MFQTSVALLLAIAICAAPHLATAGMKEGQAAFSRNDFDTAIRELTPLAEKGDAQAQLYLGMIYSDGLSGASKDDAKAAKWLRAASESGSDVAAQRLARLERTIRIARAQARGSAASSRWDPSVVHNVSTDETASLDMTSLRAVDEHLSPGRDYVQFWLKWEDAAGHLTRHTLWILNCDGNWAPIAATGTLAIDETSSTRQAGVRPRLLRIVPNSTAEIVEAHICSPAAQDSPPLPASTFVNPFAPYPAPSIR